MKPVQSVLTIVFAISALSLTVWFGRYYGACSPFEWSTGCQESGAYGIADSVQRSFWQSGRD